MKKFVALILAVVMVFALAVTASAVDATITKASDPGNTASSDVKILVTGSTLGGTVYSVDVTWGSLTFTYTYGQGREWNPETHSYAAATGGWSDAATVTVTNHSNAAVKYKAVYDPNGTANGSATVNLASADGDLNSGITLATALNTAVGDAPTSTFTVTPDGTPADATVNEATKIGTITITVLPGA